MGKQNFKSAMICVASGDAMGWITEWESKIPQELQGVYIDKFYDWSKTMGGFYWQHEEKLLAGDYSDDTQLMVCTLRSLRYSNWQEMMAFSEIPIWSLYQRGGGSSCKTQATTLSSGIYPWRTPSHELKEKYYVTGGNGGVMRILPHLFVNSDNYEQLLIDVIKNNILTHGGPVSIVGTCYYATALYISYRMHIDGYKGDYIDAFLERLESKEVINAIYSILTKPDLEAFVKNIPDREYYDNLWSQTRELADKRLLQLRVWFSEGLPETDAQAYSELGAIGKSKGSALNCAFASIYTYLKYQDLMKCLTVPANTLDTDTDSLAGMTGALCGLNLELESLPEFMKGVQDYDYILSSIDKLYEPTCNGATNYINIKKLKENIFKCKEEKTFDNIPSINNLTVCGIRDLPCLPSKQVLQALVCMDDGQRVYFKKFMVKK